MVYELLSNILLETNFAVLSSARNAHFKVYRSIKLNPIFKSTLLLVQKERKAFYPRGEKCEYFGFVVRLKKCLSQDFECKTGPRHVTNFSYYHVVVKLLILGEKMPFVNSDPVIKS